MPKFKPIIQIMLKPILILIICYFYIFGTYVNYYLFVYVGLKISLIEPKLSWLGFFSDDLFVWICRQDWKHIIKIGIETSKIAKGISVSHNHIYFYYEDFAATRT